MEISEMQARLHLTYNEAKKFKEQSELLGLFRVSERNFTLDCKEVEDMAVQIDKFIDKYALAKPGIYSKKLRKFLADKLNEYARIV